MNLDRRQFARAASSSLALFAIPGWFAACQRAEQGSADGGAGAAGEGVKLVLHVEKDVGRREKLGELFGSFLMKARIEAQAPLATCEISCATTEELGELGIALEGVPAVLVVPGMKPFAAVVELEEPNAQKARAIAEMEYDMRLRSEHEQLAAQLSRALGPGSAALNYGIERERAQSGVLAAGSDPSAELARTRPCQALRAASQEAEQRDAWLLQLALVVRDRWTKHAPAGSVWAEDRGCGVSYELPDGTQRVGALCGMGDVPELAQRFLHFFSSEELERR
ncbi:MAG: hypothetical protein NTV21_18315 [Planctomycetota bacterium]|nr:hypothetical protein [Planctomycetota bacterium]